MSDFSFTKEQIAPIVSWSENKDCELPEDAWEIAYFLDGYNFGIEKLQKELQETKKLLAELQASMK